MNKKDREFLKALEGKIDKIDKELEDNKRDSLIFSINSVAIAYIVLGFTVLISILIVFQHLETALITTFLILIIGYLVLIFSHIIADKMIEIKNKKK